MTGGDTSVKKGTVWTWVQWPFEHIDHYSMHIILNPAIELE